MRFTADIIFKGEGPYRVPTNYRRNIASLFKESILRENPDMYNRYWGDKKRNIAKPFTYCIYISGAKNIKYNDKSFLEFDKERMGITISSPDAGFLINQYNSLLNISGKYTPFNHDIELKNFRLAREIQFSGGKAQFRLMSPMVIRNMNERSDDKKKDSKYLTVEDKLFNENLSNSVRVMCREFLGEDYKIESGNFVFTPVECRTVKVFHYGEVIPAVSGIFAVEAPDEVLKLIYDAGIGARRSQGFGMVEVVK